MTVIGFTGTREGMTGSQRSQCINLIINLYPNKFHHGMCAGADTEAHQIVRKAFPNCWIVGHPPIKKKCFIHSECNEYRQPKDYIVRDRDIVDEVEILVATPLQDKEVLRSGSWTTVRYARKKGKRIFIINRDGLITVEEPNQLELELK